MGFKFQHALQAQVTECSPDRIKKQEYLVADIVQVYSLPSEVVKLHHGFKDESKTVGDIKVSHSH